MTLTPAARFDPELDAWILSTHDDVSAALREPRLAVTGSREDSSPHQAVRKAFGHSMPADRLAALRGGLARSARERVVGLPADRPLDLLASFAAPWSLALAADVTGVSHAEAANLVAPAREVFMAAAVATDGEPRPEGRAAAVELARRLPDSTATVNVQTFVALSQTLPHTLAGAWLALFGNPDAERRLRAEPGLMMQAVEELLRHAGPSRAVFRRATEDIRIGDTEIGSGDRVVLMLAAANHDPAKFANPDCLDFSRSDGGYLSFGGGAHSCSGARLTRMAVAVATDALLRAAAAIELTGTVAWIDGFAIRAPASLPVVLRRTPDPGRSAGVVAPG